VPRSISRQPFRPKIAPTRNDRRPTTQDPKSKCGPGPATPDRIRTWFPACLVTAGRRNDRFSPSALATSAAFAKASCRFAIARPKILRSLTGNRCGGQRPCPAPLLHSEERRAISEREEAATPGQPVRACALFWNVPRRFTLENHRLPLALPQSFGEIRNSHVSLNPLSARLLRLATQKTSPLVQKLWTMCLPCGSPRKTKN
jgi:hypothetical protein